MSRCFSFPPPGYEKKARTDDTDLLKKEKHREKKHKKEKKDKERSEGKEKREKDRSDGKNREKKDRKEKHRDKRKDKDKDKDKEKEKDKSSTTEDKRIAGQYESSNGEKIVHKEREWDKSKSSISNEKKQGQSGEKPIRNNSLSAEAGDFKFVQEFSRRIRDEEKGTGSQLVQRLPGTEQKNDEWTDRVVVRDTGIPAEGKEKKKEKRIDNRKIDGQGFGGEARSSGSTVVQNLAGMGQNRVEGMPRPLEKNVERRMEEKEKSKEREGGEKRGDKRKDKDREKKRHGKDKDMENEKKKEEKVKEKSEHKNKDQDKSKERKQNDLLGTSIKASHVAKDGDRNTGTTGNLKKRKEFEANGFLHETDVRPNKIPRPSPLPSTENGRKLEPCQTPIPFTSERQGPQNSLRVDNKEHKVNGVIEAQSLSLSSKKSSSATTQADHIAQASTKPPHPDSKYLSQVLSVPKMEEWSDFDDQEWLFSSKGCSSEKPDVGSGGVTEMPSVWAEALQIESADILALPYVIPF